MAGEAQEIESTESDFAQAARTILDSRYVIALTGAGLSVESGIPPFRGPGGLWTKYGEPPMDGFQRFLADPAGEWRARLHPSGPMKALAETLRKAQPNAGHRALAELERMGVLRALVTQNIDNLHRMAGHRALLEIHGNATLLRCLGCARRLPREELEIDPENLPPRCERCGGIIKSDTVQFGEPIPPDVLEACIREGERADCCVVVGTSATVYPAAQIPLDVLARGGRLVEANLYASEITRACAVSLRGPGAATLSRLVERVREMREPRDR
jgi:NAD-dependent deacetylase